MAKILAFAGSNSSQSINFQLVKHTVSTFEGHRVQLLNMANYPFPLFSEDMEQKQGYSNSLIELREDIGKAEGMVISVNEHNGNVSAYFKNLSDWLSRLDRKFLKDKKVLLMATSNSPRGGSGALEAAHKMVQRFGAEVVAQFSLPGFKNKFVEDTGIVDEELKAQHQKAVRSFLEAL